MLNQVEAFNRLDEIERLDPDPSIDLGAHKVMQDLSTTEGGLRLLIDRYASSPSAHIAGFLALTIAEQASHGNPETAPLVFDFAAKLKRNDYEGALLSTLSAMERQFGFGAAWGDSPRPPVSLFPFLEHCLSFTGKLNVLIQFGALELVTAICWRGVLQTVFTAEQIRWISKKADELSHTNDTLISEAIKELRDCFQNQPTVYRGESSDGLSGKS